MTVGFVDIDVIHVMCVIILLLYVSLFFLSSPDPVQDKSVCMGELSKADCVPGFSIITSSALYGRMALGRCLSAEFGFLGCTNDVLFLADRWCSGRRSCQFFIPNKDLDQANGRCSPDLRAYMQMSYYCVPGEL